MNKENNSPGLSNIKVVAIFLAFMAVVVTLVVWNMSPTNPTYPLRGTVKFDGKMIQDGTILFEPDKEAGNEGSSIQTIIQGGNFSIPAGQPVAFGPVIARIVDKSKPGLKLFAKLEMPETPSVDFKIIALKEDGE